jgi:hypothetical protein
MIFVSLGLLPLMLLYPKIPISFMFWFWYCSSQNLEKRKSWLAIFITFSTSYSQIVFDQLCLFLCETKDTTRRVCVASGRWKATRWRNKAREQIERFQSDRARNPVGFNIYAVCAGGSLSFSLLGTRSGRLNDIYPLLLLVILSAFKLNE